MGHPFSLFEVNCLKEKQVNDQDIYLSSDYFTGQVG